MNQQLTFEETQQQYIDAAWCFAKSLLWVGEEFSDRDVRNVLADLQHYFLVAKDLDEAFNTFCGNVILAIKNRRRCPILHPDQWLNPLYRYSLTAPRAKDAQMKTMLRKVPQFLELATIIAKHFFQYVQSPAVSIFQACNEELAKIGALDWMHFLYDAVNNKPTT